MAFRYYLWRTLPRSSCMVGFSSAFWCENQWFPAFRAECSVVSAEGCVASASHSEAKRFETEHSASEHSANPKNLRKRRIGPPNVRPGRLNVQFPNIREPNIRPGTEYSAGTTEHSEKSHHTGASTRPHTLPTPPPRLACLRGPFTSFLPSPGFEPWTPSSQV